MSKIKDADCGYNMLYGGADDAVNNDLWNLFFVMNGSMNIYMKNGVFTLFAGSGMILGAGRSFVIDPGSDGCECVDAYMSDDRFESFCENYRSGLYGALSSGFTDVFCLTLDEYSAVLRLINANNDNLDMQNDADLSAACAKSLFLRFFEKAVFDRGEQKKRPRALLKFLYDIKLPENRDKTLTEIMSSGEYCPDHFVRLFKKHMGVTPLAYVNSLKLEDAKRLLRTTELPLREIASELGFESESYFHKLFTTTFSMTPKKYRDRFKSAK